MSGFKYVEDPILGKGRAEFIGGGTGGESYVAGDGIAINGNTISATGGSGDVTEAEFKDLSDGTQSVSKSLKQARWVPRELWQTTSKYNTVTFMHFSDIHADTSALARIVADSEMFADNVDDMICTGDMVDTVASPISSWWEPSVLTVIGNHECATTLDGDWAALSMADRVAYYISPFESSWGTISRPSGKTWYYKDYEKQNLKVRLVVLDLQCYFTEDDTEGAAQTTWLASTLSSARTNGYHVVIACHAPSPGSIKVPCSFSETTSRGPESAESNCPSDVVDVVSSAISSGLHFCGYICGHWHGDFIWDVKGDGTQYMFDVTTANSVNKKQWGISDMYRDSTIDAYNLVTIDPVHTRVRIVRGGGANVSNSMRKRQIIEVNYSTGQIVDYERPRLSGSGRIEVAGITIRDKRYIDTVAVTGETMTMQAGRAYSADVADAGTLTLNSEQVGTSSYGEVGLIDIHLGNSASVSVGPNVVMIDGFTSSARNICEVQFIDGLAIVKPITVIVDVISGYYVTITTGTGSGSLYYGLADATEHEIIFDAYTDGTPCDLGGVSVGTDKLITGNGIASTTISGAVDCGVYGTTVTSLNLSGSTITGGTMTILGAGAPGGTVQLDGFIEPRSVSGGVYDFSSHASAANTSSGCFIASGGSVAISGATLCNATGIIPLFYDNVSTVNMTSCLITGATVDNLAEACALINGGNIEVTGCTFSHMASLKNYASIGLHFYGSFSAVVSGCLFTSNIGKGGYSNGFGIIANLNSSTRLDIHNCVMSGNSSSGQGTINLYSNYAGNIVNISGCTFTKDLSNDGDCCVRVGASANISNCQFNVCSGSTKGIGVVAENTGTYVSMGGCQVVSGIAKYGAYGVEALDSATLIVNDCVVVSNHSGTAQQDFRAISYGHLAISGSTVGCGVVYSGGTLTLAGTNTVGEIFSATETTGVVVISSGASVTLTSSIIPGGEGAITVLTGGCVVNGASISAGTYTQIVSSGGSAVAS